MLISWQEKIHLEQCQMLYVNLMSVRQNLSTLHFTTTILTRYTDFSTTWAICSDGGSDS
jgi:hypothetical protein